MERPALRTLIIEDDAAVAEFLKEMLTGGGRDVFQSQHAASLAQGIERLAKETFDVVLLDLCLPDSRGLTTVAAVHTASPELAIVVVSGSLDESGYAEECLHMGAQDYLAKGDFDRRHLQHSLRYAVQRKRIENDYKAAQDALVKVNQALLEKVHELDRLNAIMMGREERIIEMKEEIKAMKERAI